MDDHRGSWMVTVKRKECMTKGTGVLEEIFWDLGWEFVGYILVSVFKSGGHPSHYRCYVSGVIFPVLYSRRGFGRDALGMEDWERDPFSQFMAAQLRRMAMCLNLFSQQQKKISCMMVVIWKEINSLPQISVWFGYSFPTSSLSEGFDVKVAPSCVVC